MVTPPLRFCGGGVCGTEPGVVIVVVDGGGDVVVVDDTTLDDGAFEGFELVAGVAATGTWKGTAIFD